MKRAALYLRVSTIDQHPETQGIEVRQFAQQRGYEIVEEYIDHGFSGTITLGYGDPGCEDRLNTLYYRVPILNEERPMGGPDRLVVLLDSTVVVAEQPGLYRDGEDVVRDELADLEDFFTMIKRALVPVLAEYYGAG